MTRFLGRGIWKSWFGKRKPRPVANAPPIDVFPRTTSSRDPLRMITSGTLITLQRPIFKTTLGQTGFLCPKFQHFSRFGEKHHLDKMTGIHYLKLSRRLSQYSCCLISGLLHIGMLPATAHSLKFPVIPISKGHSLKIKFFFQIIPSQNRSKV